MAEEIIITQLKPMSAVLSIYSGRPGCACGCRGKYYYRNMQIALAKGYPSKDDREEVKKFPAMLSRVYRIFQNALLQGRVKSWVGSENDFVVFEVNENRTYTMYYTR